MLGPGSATGQVWAQTVQVEHEKHARHVSEQGRTAEQHLVAAAVGRSGQEAGPGVPRCLADGL